MFDEIDRIYYQLRAREERNKADMTSDISTRRTHELLATEYDRRAEKIIRTLKMP